MCTTRADALRLPFTCGLATGQPLAAAMPESIGPRLRGAHELLWADVAAGIMLTNGVLRAGRVAGRPALERELLMRARRTWMPQATGLELLLMASCSPASADDARVAPPEWFESRPSLPATTWHCFRGRDRLGVSLWRKTAALLATLLRIFPAKRIYLKIDSDTMLMPHALLRFLQALHAATPRSQPLYFGSNRIASKRRFCGGRLCLLGSRHWRELEQRVADNQTAHAARRRAVGNHAAPLRLAARSAEEGCESAEASYAQGGAYGFDRRALSLLASDSCLERVGAAVAHHDGVAVPDLFEDEAVGLCMRLHRVRLVTCGCFYDWGPCNIHATDSCAADTNASRLCHLPLTVHKLRQTSWFDGWWRLLAAREPAALAALNQWATTHVGARAISRP